MEDKYLISRIKSRKRIKEVRDEIANDKKENQPLSTMGQIFVILVYFLLFAALIHGCTS